MPLPDNAIFTKTLKDNLGSRIAAAAIPLGLPPSSIGPLIGGLTSHNNTAVGLVPGVTPQIIQASVGALLKSFSVGFRYVWVSAGCFTVVAAIGMFLPTFFFSVPPACRPHHSPFSLCCAAGEGDGEGGPGSASRLLRAGAIVSLGITNVSCG